MNGSELLGLALTLIGVLLLLAIAYLVVVAVFEEEDFR